MDIIGIIFNAVLYGIIYDALKLVISLYNKKGKPVKEDNSNPLSFLSTFLGGGDKKEKKNALKGKNNKRKRKRKREDEDITIPNLTKQVQDSDILPNGEDDFFKDVRKDTQPSSTEKKNISKNLSKKEGLSGFLDMLSKNGGDGKDGGMNAILKMGAELVQNGGIQEIMGKLSESMGKEGGENPLTNVLKTLGDPKRIEKIEEKPDLESDEDDIKNIIESLD